MSINSNSVKVLLGMLLLFGLGIGLNPLPFTLRGTVNCVDKAKISEDGSTIICFGGQRITIFRTAPGQSLTLFQTVQFTDNTWLFNVHQISADGLIIAYTTKIFGSTNGRVNRLQAPNKSTQYNNFQDTTFTFPWNLGLAEFSKDGRYFYTRISSTNCRLYKWLAGYGYQLINW